MEVPLKNFGPIGSLGISEVQEFSAMRSQIKCTFSAQIVIFAWNNVPQFTWISLYRTCNQKSLVLGTSLTYLQRIIVLLADYQIFSLPALDRKFLIVVFMAIA